MVADLGEGSVCLLAGTVTTALPCCSYHHFISNRNRGSDGGLWLTEAVFGLQLFLFKSGPSRPASGSCLFHCSLGACPGFMRAVVVGQGGNGIERYRRGIETLPLCHCAPTSARVTHLLYQPTFCQFALTPQESHTLPLNGGTGCSGKLLEETPKSGCWGDEC